MGHHQVPAVRGESQVVGSLLLENRVHLVALQFVRPRPRPHVPDLDPALLPVVQRHDGDLARVAWPGRELVPGPERGPGPRRTLDGQRLRGEHAPLRIHGEQTARPSEDGDLPVGQGLDRADRAVVAA
ncbi:hypothetical protein LUW77_00740 [Streptomyces radiopugnans]|nr:hypothetical protein LUW77_00740 [Streptomyces radiopugnans]